MNEKRCSVSLFENLSTSLVRFIKAYPGNDLTPNEKPYFKKLETVNSELVAFLQDTSTNEKFTSDNYDIFILRIQWAIPPSIVKKSNGVLGIGASETTTLTAFGNAVTRLLTDVEKAKQKIEEAQKVSEKSEKKTISEKSKEPDDVSQKASSSTSSGMESMQNQLMALAQQFKDSQEQAKKQAEESKKQAEDSRRQVENLEKRIDDSNKQAEDSQKQIESLERRVDDSKKKMEESKKLVQQAYQNGKKEGRQETITFLRGVVGKYLDYNKQQELFLLLENGDMPSEIRAVTPEIFKDTTNSKKSEPKISNEDQEKEKLRKSVGDEKFAVIEKLVKVHNLPNISKIEKLVAKWLIFELMFGRKEKISNAFSITLRECSTLKEGLPKYPQLKALFDTYLAYDQDSVSNKDLDENDYLLFHQLTKGDGKGNGLYLPYDGTAAKCFGSYWKQKKGETNFEFTSEETYRKRKCDDIIKLENENHKITSNQENVSVKAEVGSIPTAKPY